MHEKLCSCLLAFVRCVAQARQSKRTNPSCALMLYARRHQASAQPDFDYSIAAAQLVWIHKVGLRFHTIRILPQYTLRPESLDRLSFAVCITLPQQHREPVLRC